MKRKPLYGRATRRRSVSSRAGEDRFVPFAFDDVEQGPSLTAQLWRKTKAFTARHDRIVPAGLAILITLGLIGGWRLAHPAAAALTQWDIDNAVKYTMAHTQPPPAKTTMAAAMVGPSVVRVDGYLSPEHAAAAAKAAGGRGKEEPRQACQRPNLPPAQDADAKDDDHPDSTGSGVVIDDKGDILTNLHVIHSTDRWVITFFDGSKSDADVVNVQPENDLAVIRAKTSPDDLKPATLASTAGLNPGDTVVAVGFPFGIGPSVSSGVVAGLKREFDDPDRQGQAGTDQPDPVRRGGESRQFRRPAGQPRRRSRGHRHRASTIPPASTSLPAWRLPCRSRTPPRRWANNPF